MAKQKSNNNRNTEELKRILIKFVGGEKEPVEVFIGPGTTTADLLRELNLDTNGFFVSKGTEDTTFGAGESLYPVLEDGGLVYVASQVTAGQ